MGWFGRLTSRLVSIILRTPGDAIASRLPLCGVRPGFVPQTGLLILTPIDANQKCNLIKVLDKVREKLSSIQMTVRECTQKGQVPNKSSFFATETVHYAAWIILPGIKTKDRTGSEHTGDEQLLFETNYDGTIDCHLLDLVRHCRAELDLVYCHFPDYPKPGANDSDVIAFLKSRCELSNSVNSMSVYYTALPGRTVRDIENAIAVYEEAKRVVDNPSTKWEDKKSIRAAIIDHFEKLPPEKSEKTPRRSPITQRGLRAVFVTNMTVLALLCLVPPFVYFGLWSHGAFSFPSLHFTFSLPLLLILLCPIPVVYVVTWLIIDLVALPFENAETHKERELRKRGETPFDPTEHAPEYTHLDIGRQNHLCTFATVKPGWFRMFVLKRGLWLGAVLSRHIFVLGSLDQMSTVHFARWTLIDKQLLFYGNYDGSWSSYLTDFSDEAWAVNMLWGNTIGFPQTKGIVGAGARDLDGFQMQAVTHYAPAQVFYSRYPDHSLINLVRYLEFRDGLLDELGR